MYRKIAFVVLSFFFHISHLFSDQYQLSIGMIFQNEAPYLKEWIEYHLLVGVDHFYLYNDQSSDDYQQVLAPYVSQGVVELFHAVPQNDFNGTQIDCYNKTLQRAYRLSKWVAMIDSDEFLVTPKGKKIIDVLNQFEDFGGVVINWRSFGTSHVPKIPLNRLMIECLTHCAASEHYMNHMVKSIVRPRCVKCFLGPHWAEYRHQQFAVDTDGERYVPSTPLCKMDQLWINHYWTRDEEFLFNKKIPRSIPWGRSMQSILKTAEELNIETDKTVLRHVPDLRKRMFKISR